MCKTVSNNSVISGSPDRSQIVCRRFQSHHCITIYHSFAHAHSLGGGGGEGVLKTMPQTTQFKTKVDLFGISIT